MTITFETLQHKGQYLIPATKADYNNLLEAQQAVLINLIESVELPNGAFTWGMKLNCSNLEILTVSCKAKIEISAPTIG